MRTKMWLKNFERSQIGVVVEIGMKKSWLNDVWDLSVLVLERT